MRIKLPPHCEVLSRSKFEVRAIDLRLWVFLPGFATPRLAGRFTASSLAGGGGGKEKQGEEEDRTEQNRTRATKREKRKKKGGGRKRGRGGAGGKKARTTSRCRFLENDQGNGLRDALKLAIRGDFCVGYFNLRGWRSIDSVVESWPQADSPPCRLLVGMTISPDEELRLLLASGSDHTRLDNATVVKLKNRMAAEFRRQLTLGIPNDADEAGLRRLARQLRDGRLQVKLFLKHQLHAKLYLAHRHDTINPTIAYLGSSNLTFAGLRKQGELNVDVLDKDAAAKLTQWFEDRWKENWCLDITQELIAIIEESWASEAVDSPASHLFEDRVAPVPRRTRWDQRVSSAIGCHCRFAGIPNQGRPACLASSEQARWCSCRGCGRPGKDPHCFSHRPRDGG